MAGIEVIRLQEMSIEGFKCRKCGNCCRWDGFVNLAPEDVRCLADFLQIGESEFIERYARPGHLPSVVLKERPSKECVFLNGNLCCVYEARPGQCSSFPYRWRTPSAYKLCPGIKELSPVCAE